MSLQDIPGHMSESERRAEVEQEEILGEMEERHVDSPHDRGSLTSTDIKADPILSALAKQQGASKSSAGSSVNSPKATFKARPAPSSTYADGMGPKMTKSAALRQGLDWEAMKPTRSESAKNIGFETTPGHKRTMSHNIASLAAPKTAPRQNRSSQLRAGEESVESVKKDMAAAALANKAREKAERDARRKSVALPPSLSTPSIAPRANKSSLLRAGSMKAPTGSMSAPPVSWKPKGALVASSAANLKVTQEEPVPKKEKPVARRASMMGTLKSLATPSIAPRMNKAALLRAPGSTATPSISSSPSMPTLSAPLAKPAGSSTTGQSVASTAAAPSTDPTNTKRLSLNPHPGPKPTKASLLRAGLGAKFMASKA